MSGAKVAVRAPERPSIHPTAVVDATAAVHPTALVGPYAVIGPETAIGPETTVGAHAVVEYATLGRGNQIFPGAFVGGAPQDLKYKGEKTRLVMGDGNAVREAATLNRGSHATGETRIGSGCLFMAYSHVAHDCRVGDRVILANGTALAGHVEVGEGAVISGMVGIHQYVRIGSFAMISGGSMIGQDVPPYCICQGDRATLRGINVTGLRRGGFSREETLEIRRAYRTLFLSGLPLKEALADLRRGRPGPRIAALADFIEASKRGVTRPAPRPGSPLLDDEQGEE